MKEPGPFPIPFRTARRMLLQACRGRCGSSQLPLCSRLLWAAPRKSHTLGATPPFQQPYFSLAWGRPGRPMRRGVGARWRRHLGSAGPRGRVGAAGGRKKEGGPGRAAPVPVPASPPSPAPPRAHDAAVPDLGGVQPRGREALPRRPHEGTWPASRRLGAQPRGVRGPPGGRSALGGPGGGGWGGRLGPRETDPAGLPEPSASALMIGPGDALTWAEIGVLSGSQAALPRPFSVPPPSPQDFRGFTCP